MSPTPVLMQVPPGGRDDRALERRSRRHVSIARRDRILDLDCRVKVATAVRIVERHGWRQPPGRATSERYQPTGTIPARRWSTFLRTRPNTVRAVASAEPPTMMAAPIITTHRPRLVPHSPSFAFSETSMATHAAMPNAMSPTRNAIDRPKRTPPPRGSGHSQRHDEHGKRGRPGRRPASSGGVLITPVGEVPARSRTYCDLGSANERRDGRSCANSTASSRPLSVTIA